MRSIIGRPLGIPWLLRRPSRWGFKISGKNLNNIERQKLFQQPTSEIATSRKTWASGDIYLWSQKDSLRPSGGKWRPDRKGLFPFWGMSEKNDHGILRTSVERALSIRVDSPPFLTSRTLKGNKWGKIIKKGLSWVKSSTRSAAITSHLILLWDEWNLHSFG